MRFTCRNESREYTIDMDYFIDEDTLYLPYMKPIRSESVKDRIFKQMSTVFANTQKGVWLDVADWLDERYEAEVAKGREDETYMRLKDSMPIRCEMVKELERMGEDPSDERLLDSMYKVKYQVWENLWKANGTRKRIERMVRLINLWGEGGGRKLSSVTGMYMPGDAKKRRYPEYETEKVVDGRKTVVRYSVPNLPNT